MIFITISHQTPSLSPPHLIISTFGMTIMCIYNVSEHWSVMSGIICLPSPNLKITGFLARFGNQVTMVTSPLGDGFRGKDAGIGQRL